MENCCSTFCLGLAAGIVHCEYAEIEMAKNAVKKSLFIFFYFDKDEDLFQNQSSESPRNIIILQFEYQSPQNLLVILQPQKSPCSLF